MTNFRIVKPPLKEGAITVPFAKNGVNQDMRDRTVSVICAHCWPFRSRAGRGARRTQLRRVLARASTQHELSLPSLSIRASRTSQCSLK